MKANQCHTHIKSQIQQKTEAIHTIKLQVEIELHIQQTSLLTYCCT